LEELSSGKGKLTEASEKGEGIRRAVKPTMKMMMIIVTVSKY
jgi:hypothetical protein